MLPYETISVTRASAAIRCLNCDTRQTVDLDEDGEPCVFTCQCADDDCTVRLCDNCPQFKCNDCGLDFCESHKIEYNGENFCRVCFEANREEECECHMRGDQADASDCPAHGGRHAA